MTDLEMATMEEIVKEIQKRHEASVVIVKHLKRDGEGEGPSIAQWCSGHPATYLGMMTITGDLHRHCQLAGFFQWRKQ